MAVLSILKFLLIFIGLSLVMIHLFRGIFGKDEKGLVKAIKALFGTGAIILAISTVEYLLALYT